MSPKTRPVSWIAAALKEFETFPIAKPLKGMGSGVFEVALSLKRDAFRVVYAVQLGDEVWVVHAFQKKSTRGIKTPKHEIDLIKDRLRRLKEILR